VMFVNTIRDAVRRLLQLEKKYDRMQEALGRIESRQLSTMNVRTPAEAEYRVFSQWGEDGIIDWLTTRVPIEHKIFIEFGVENYTEANTRFLLMHKNWSGLIMDSSDANIDSIKHQDISWRYSLKAAAAFITRENINSLFREHGMSGDIGLLSIDIDGNDYWVWEAIDSVSPRIVVVEYNSRLGPDRSVSIPYDEKFSRASGHHSMIYYGASLRAFWKLGQKKGYELVCCNTAGNNAFFVRKDVMPEGLRAGDVGDIFVRGKFRETRDENGRLTYLEPREEERILSALDWVEV
jgi:hypothetical protein